jgi:23S rRNA (pseudouridine1915-N3)-methyltransferase
MKIKLVVIGKLKEKIYKERIDEYVKWINKDLPIELIFLKENKKDKINKKLKNHMRSKDHVICVSEKGKAKSSMQMSRFLFNGTRDLVFFIGGPDGHPKFIMEKADTVLSLSLMTFPHEMALLILAEQIYRAISIKKGTKYHR